MAHAKDPAVTRADYDKAVAERDEARKAAAGLKRQLADARRDVEQLRKQLAAEESMLRSARADADRNRERAKAAEAAQVVVAPDAPIPGPRADEPRWMYSPRELPPIGFEFSNQEEAEEAIKRDGEGSWFAYAGDAEAEYHRRQNAPLEDADAGAGDHS